MILGMPIVAIAWIYVVGMAAIAEALSTQGTLLGALLTFVFYGVLPLAIVLYLLGTPGRKKAQRRRQAPAQAAPPDGSASLDPDRSSHASGRTMPPGAPEREEP